MPLIPGNIKSRMINAGGSFSLSAAVNPASPVLATIVGKLSRSRLYFKLSEMSGSSSMMRTGCNIKSNEMSDARGQMSNFKFRDLDRHLTSCISHLSSTLYLAYYMPHHL